MERGLAKDTKHGGGGRKSASSREVEHQLRAEWPRWHSDIPTMHHHYSYRFPFPCSRADKRTLPLHARPFNAPSPLQTRSYLQALGRDMNWEAYVAAKKADGDADRAATDQVFHTHPWMGKGEGDTKGAASVARLPLHIPPGQSESLMRHHPGLQRLTLVS